MSFQRKVAAVVTTFNPGETILQNLARIADQVDIIVVVDDSGTSNKVQSIDYSNINNLILLRNEENLGISAALNRGVLEAELMGCNWVITLDDDTMVSSSYMETVFKFLKSGLMPSIGMVACSRDVEGVKLLPNENGFKVKRTIITSGAVFEIKSFSDVGGFDESLFIDLVDFDFCTKLRKSGRTIVRLDKVEMSHKVGNSQIMSFLGKKILIYNHHPFRLYYQMRNVFIFARKHLRFDPFLSLYLLLDVFRLPIKALLFEQEKQSRFFFLAQGLKDGLLLKSGRLTKILK